MATTGYTTINGTMVSENRAGVKRDYMRDSLGSTTALLDNTQTQTDTFFYWPYGEIRTQTGTTKTPFTFVGTLGYYMDIASSLFYVRMRHLRSLLARWLTVDRLWPTQPAYEYADNAPVRRVDPSGLQVGGTGGSGHFGVPSCYIVDYSYGAFRGAGFWPCWGLSLKVQIFPKCKDSSGDIWGIIGIIFCAIFTWLCNFAGVAGFCAAACAVAFLGLLLCAHLCENETGDTICVCFCVVYCYLWLVPLFTCGLPTPCCVSGVCDCVQFWESPPPLWLFGS